MDGLPDGRADGWTDGRAGRQGISQVYKPIQPSESRRRCDDLSRLGALVTCTLIAVHHTYHGHPGERAVGIEAASIQAGSSLTQRALHIEPTTGGSARLKCRAQCQQKVSPSIACWWQPAVASDWLAGRECRLVGCDFLFFFLPTRPALDHVFISRRVEGKRCERVK